MPASRNNSNTLRPESTVA